MSKGDFLYLDRKKKKQLIITIFSLIMVAVICVTGIIMYDTRKSVFAVMAALASLPAAKMLVGYLVLMPYKSVNEDVKNDIEKVSGDKEYYKVVYDSLLASTEKSMYAGVIFIKNGKILCYTDHYKIKNKKKIKASDIEEYIKSIVKDSCNYSVIKFYDDRDKFMKMVSSEATSHENMTEEEKKKMITMNEKIEARIKIFIF